MVLGKNKQITVTTGMTGLLPVKDGDDYTVGKDKRDKLYYETTDTVSFANANQDQQTAKLNDRPTSRKPWTYNYKGHVVNLIGTSGLDSFRTWLVIRRKSWSSTAYRRLGYIDWKVKYKSSVTPDVNDPPNSTVAPGSGSGGQVTPAVKGVGVYLPVTGAESANSNLEPRASSW
ncbi:MAG: hypothetical protein ACLP4R_03455 [Solirubrobacteraceae bacterium]